MRFFERAEIKDAMAYLRLLVNPHDDAAFERAIHVPSRGVGEKTLAFIREQAKLKEVSLWSAVVDILKQDELTPRASNALKSFVNAFSQWQQVMPELSLSSLAMTIIEESGLLIHYTEKHKERADSKRENLMELVNAVEEFTRQNPEEGSLVLFLTQAALEAGEWQAHEHEVHVHLMTLHAAKGLEFPMVFMIGMEEGLFPSQMSMDEPGRLEEERRLCYVGMTRAMEKLYLCYAEVRRQYGREQYHRPSRFLAELPMDLVHAIRPRSNNAFKPQTATISQPVDVNAPFRIGQTVSHAHFGSGVVLAMEGQDSNMRIQVRFNQHGAKWLVLAYAKLTAVDF